MLGAFIVLPESEPWYYELLLFNTGFLLACYPKLNKLFKKISLQNG